jgi:hypothetical protein
VSNVKLGSKLRLSEDGVRLGDPVIVWSEAPGQGCYWVQRPDDPRSVMRVRVTQHRNLPHPIVTITEEQL